MSARSTSSTSSNASSIARQELPAHPRSRVGRPRDHRPPDGPHLRVRAGAGGRARRGDRRVQRVRGARRHPRRCQPHRRAERQGRHRVHRARSRPSVHLRRVLGPRGRPRDGHGAAGHAGLHHHQDSRRRGGRAAPLRREAQPQRAQRASEQRALPPQPAPQGAHHRSARPELRRAEDARRAGAPGHRGVAHASGSHPPPVRDRGAGDLRRHGGDQVHRPRARRPLQDRRGVARGEPRSRGRLRRPEAAAFAWWWKSCATSAST